MDEICVICHEADQLIDMPCQCRGSGGHIHAQCLETMRKTPAWSLHCPQCKTHWRDVVPWYYQWRANISREELMVVSACISYPLLAWLCYTTNDALVASALIGAFETAAFRMLRLAPPSYISPTTTYCLAISNGSVLLAIWVLCSALPQYALGRSALLMDWTRALFALEALCALPVVVEVAQRLARLPGLFAAEPDLRQAADIDPTAMDQELAGLWSWETRVRQRYIMPVLLRIGLLTTRDADEAELRAQISARLAEPLQFPRSGEPQYIAHALNLLPFPKLTLRSATYCIAACVALATWL